MKNNFDRFDGIQHKPLRVYNRYVLLSNLIEDFGKEVGREYISTFNEVERLELYRMGSMIKALGSDEMKKKVTEGMEFEDVSDG